MSLTGAQLLQGLSEFIEDWWSSTTTSVSADGTTIVDTALQAFGEDELTDGWVRITQAGTNAWAVRRVTSFLGSTLTVAPAFAATPGSGDTYEFHRFDPRLKFKALDRARTLAYPQLAIVRLNETLTGDGENSELTIPPALRKGPVEVWEQDMLDPRVGWNALADPEGNSLAATWTAAGATASLYARSDRDLLVPKHENNCVKLVGSGTYKQTVGAMTITAAQAAGRRVTFGRWVYQRASTGTAFLSLTHDSATVSSSIHGGLGWEFLTVTATIPSGNATTLSVIVNTGGAVTIFVEHAFLVAADRLPMKYTTLLPKRGIVRDDTTTLVRLMRPPRRGYQLRLVGRAPLSALGTTAATQVTNTMEVDEHSARLLYAKATRALLMGRGWSTARVEDVYPYVKATEDEFAELTEDWSYDLPHETRLDGWWSLP